MGVPQMSTHEVDRSPVIAFRLTHHGKMAALLLCLSLPGLASAQTNYIFTPIANIAPDTRQLSVNCVGLNNLGTVIVVVAQSTPGALPDLWRSNGLAGETPEVVAQNVSTLCASINDSGQMAYGQGSSGGVAELIRNTNGTETALARSDVFPFFAQTYFPAISANGSVLFHGSGHCSGIPAPPPWGIYVTPSGPTVYECSDSAFDVTSAVSMNDSQVVTFAARSLADGSIGIYRGPGTTPLVADTQVLQSAALAVINNANTVAFAGVVNGEFALYSTSDGLAITRVSDSTLNVQPGNLFSINDSGAVAYEAGHPSGTGDGIYIGTGAALHAVIETGDVLDNSTVLDVRLWPEGLNNSGQVAFFARLADGREGVYRADPVAPGCAANVTANVSFSDGRLQLNRRTGTYSQKLRMTIANEGPAAITGPVSLALDQLSSGVVLLNGDGTTSCASPLGSPYVNLNVGTDTVWSRKERITIELEFTSPSSSISFARRVLAGPGGR
jgi:hypothetical protein